MTGICTRKMLAALGVFALLISLPGLAKAEGQPNFAGRFKGEKLSAEFIAAGDGSFTGTIYMRDSKFPLKAHVENGELHGSFSTGGDEFPFTAQLAGGALSLTSGSATYSMNRLVENPLAHPGGGDAAPQKPAMPPNPLAGAAEPATGTGDDREALFKQGEDAEKRRDYAAALELYQKAADLGHAGAMDDIGYFYQQGLGVKQDWAAAKTWYTKAADAGNMPAMDNLGWMYAHGTGVPVDYAQAMSWYMKAADKGYGSSMNKIGLLYLYGNGVEKDPAKAVEWFRKSAENGAAEGMFDLGYAYEHGTVVEHDDAQALQWYRKSADGGDASAMNRVGLFYLEAKGTEKNPSAAAEWFHKAADAGDVDGIFDYAYCFENGVGVPQDMKTATQWYRAAAAGGSDDAKQWLAKHNAQ